MSIQLQPPVTPVPLVTLVKTEPPTVIQPPVTPVPLVTLVKTEPPTVIKNEPPEEVLEEISTDMKDIDIIYHPLCEDLIKSETVLEDIPENKHLESVQTQAFVCAFVKAENSPFIKTENITQRNKSEDTSDGNVSRGTGQGVVEVQASHEHCNALSKLKTDEQFVLNFSKNLNGISVRSRKSKCAKKTDCDECYKTDETTLWEKEKEKIKVIKAPVIPVEAHEYTSLANDRHVCNHCQQKYKTLKSLKAHNRTNHREVTTMYLCHYCSYKSKFKYIIENHIIVKHKDTKDIQWFQCNLCEKKFKLKYALTQHMKKVHLTHEQMQDGLDIKRFRHYCDKCDYKTYISNNLIRHNLVHLKPEEIEYFYCYHCSYKCQRKDKLKLHIFRHFKNVEVKQGKRYDCNKCHYKTHTSTNLQRHKLIHLKPEDISYFYCYHCSHKNKRKQELQKHIFRHFKYETVPFHCYICDFITQKRETIIEHIKKHSKVQIKVEINEGR